jgi:hypothetical protein
VSDGRCRRAGAGHDEVLLLHHNFLGIEYAAQRHAEERPGLGSLDFYLAVIGLSMLLTLPTAGQTPSRF